MICASKTVRDSKEKLRRVSKTCTFSTKHTKIRKTMPVMLKIISEYSQDLWNFIIWITEGVGVTEGRKRFSVRPIPKW